MEVRAQQPTDEQLYPRRHVETLVQANPDLPTALAMDHGPNRDAAVREAALKNIITASKAYAEYQVSYGDDVGDPGAVPGLFASVMLCNGQYGGQISPSISWRAQWRLKLRRKMLKMQQNLYDESAPLTLADGRKITKSILPKFSCSEGCSAAGGQGAPVFVPCFGNYKEDKDSGLYVAMPPIDKMLRIPWSPVPSLMGTRLPDIMVCPRPVNDVQGKLIKPTVYAQRVFFILDSRKQDDTFAGTCAYRVGRFVCQGLGEHTRYFAWQAEMGRFNEKQVFLPRQNVVLVFMKPETEGSYQFSNLGRGRSRVISRDFCGFCWVRCSVPNSEYESGPWQVSVFSHFDGSLRSFLDGPDVESCETQLEEGAQNRNALVQYQVFGFVWKYKRFQMGNMSLNNLWSRTITCAQVLMELFRPMYSMATSPSGNQWDLMRYMNICPDGFVYDCSGYCLADVARPLMMSSSDGDQNVKGYFSRTNATDLAQARTFFRDSFYSFAALGADAMCYRDRDANGAQKDYVSAAERCLGRTGSASELNEYPRAHAADPFFPLWLLKFIYANKSWYAGLSSDHKRMFEIHAAIEQMFLLMRYTALKMGLGAFLHPDIAAENSVIGATKSLSEYMSEMQTATAPEEGSDLLHSKMWKYCQDMHDMQLFVAQTANDQVHRIKIDEFNVGSWTRCLNAVRLNLGPVLRDIYWVPRAEPQKEASAYVAPGYMKPGFEIPAVSERSPLSDLVGGMEDMLCACSPLVSMLSGHTFDDIIKTLETVNKFDRLRISRTMACLEHFAGVMSRTANGDPTNIATLVDQTQLV